MDIHTSTNLLSCKFLITIILLLTSHHAPSVSAVTKPANLTYTNFIKTSCNTTTYPSLCFQTLSPYATSVKTNPLKLCNAALTVALKSARAASANVSTLAKQKNLTSQDATIIKDCVGNIRSGIDELKQSLKALGSIGGSANKRFDMASIKTWTSAALTDENTCTDGFAGGKVSESVKSQLRSWIVSLARVTNIALSLINQLNF